MMDTSKTNFVKQYEPDKQARVELKNGRILDVINGRYFDAGTSIILHNGKIESMRGPASEPRVPADFTIDLKGKTVLPSLYNTHCHVSGTGPTMIPSLRDRRLIKKHTIQQPCTTKRLEFQAVERHLSAIYIKEKQPIILRSWKKGLFLFGQVWRV